jgi:hypothetical protein
MPLSFSKHHSIVIGVLSQSLSNPIKKSFSPLSSTTNNKQESVTTELTTMAQIDLTQASKLATLCSKMKELDLDMYIVPSDDPHLSSKLFRFYVSL